MTSYNEFMCYNSAPDMPMVPMSVLTESAPSQLPGEGPAPAGQVQTAAGAVLTSHLGCETQLVGGTAPVPMAVDPPSRGMGRMVVDGLGQAVPPPPKYPEIGGPAGQNALSAGASLLPTAGLDSRKRFCYFDLGEEGGNLVFSLSFKETYPEEVQKVGPLNIRGSISLVARGPLDYSKEEKIEEEMKAALTALVGQFKSAFELAPKGAPPTSVGKAQGPSPLVGFEGASSSVGVELLGSADAAACAPRAPALPKSTQKDKAKQAPPPPPPPPSSKKDEHHNHRHKKPEQKADKKKEEKPTQKAEKKKEDKADQKPKQIAPQKTKRVEHKADQPKPAPKAVPAPAPAAVSATKRRKTAAERSRDEQTNTISSSDRKVVAALEKELIAEKVPYQEKLGVKVHKSEDILAFLRKRYTKLDDIIKYCNIIQQREREDVNREELISKMELGVQEPAKKKRTLPPLLVTTQGEAEAAKALGLQAVGVIANQAPAAAAAPYTPSCDKSLTSQPPPVTSSTTLYTPSSEVEGPAADPANQIAEEDSGVSVTQQADAAETAPAHRPTSDEARAIASKPLGGVCSSSFNSTKGWCRIGKLYLSKETARIEVEKAIQAGMQFYAALMCEMLEGSIEPSDNLIRQTTEAWDGLAKSYKDVVIEQGLTICYAMAWEERGKFAYDVGSRISHYVVDQILGAVMSIRDQRPIPPPKQHTQVMLPIGAMRANGFDLNMVKKEIVEEEMGKLPESIPQPKKYYKYSARENPEAFWPKFDKQGLEVTNYTDEVNDWYEARRNRGLPIEEEEEKEEK